MIEKYKNKTIVFFGDSITDTCKRDNPNYKYGAGYVNMVKTELDVCYPDLNITIYNEGINADETGHLLERFNESIVNKNPDLVFMLIGINDVWHPFENKNDYCNADIISRIDLLVKKIKNLGSEVVLITPYLFPREPFLDFFTELYPHFESFYNEYKIYIEAKKLDYIDIHKILKPYADISNNRVTKDSVHPDVIGHGIIAQAIIDYLTK